MCMITFVVVVVVVSLQKFHVMKIHEKNDEVYSTIVLAQNAGQAK